MFLNVKSLLDANKINDNFHYMSDISISISTSIIH